MVERVELYTRMLQQVIDDHREHLDPTRLTAFLHKAHRKYPLLKELRVTERGQLQVPEEFPHDDKGMEALSMVLVCIYNALKMFLGDSRAKQMIVETVEGFHTRHASEIESAGLSPYLPRNSPVAERPAERPAEPKEELLGVGTPVGKMVYDEVSKTWARSAVPAAAADDEWRIDPVYERPPETPPLGSAAARAAAPAVEASVATQFQFLQEPFGKGVSTLVEGGPEALHRLGIRFLSEGLRSGEAVIAVLGVPLHQFYLDLLEDGVDMAQCADHVYLIDWYSFKERRVGGAIPEKLGSIEDQGNLLSLPGPPEYLVKAFKDILDKIDEKRPTRCFVGVLSYGLRFVDFETIFNFAQTAQLRLRRKGVPGLFTLEAEAHDSTDRTQLVDLFGRTMVLLEERDTPSGGLELSGVLSQGTDHQQRTWSLSPPRGEPSTAGPPQVAPQATRPVAAQGHGTPAPDGDEDLEGWIARLRAEAEVTPLPTVDDAKEAPTAARMAALSQEREAFETRLRTWQESGFRVDHLRKVARENPQTLDDELATFERLLTRMSTQIARLQELDINQLEDRIEEVHALLPDVYSVSEVERRVNGLFAARRALDADRSRGEAMLPYEKELEQWRAKGYDVHDLLALLQAPLPQLAAAVDVRRQQIYRLEMLAERAKQLRPLMSDLEFDLLTPLFARPANTERLAAELERVAARSHTSGAPTMRLGTAPAAPTPSGPQGEAARRNALLNELFGWALEGWCVSALDRMEFFSVPLPRLEAQMDQLRLKVRRLQQIEHELELLDVTGFEVDVAQLRTLLGDVDRLPQIEEQWDLLHALIEAGRRMPGPTLPHDEVLRADPVAVDGDRLEDLWAAVKARLLPP